MTGYYLDEGSTGLDALRERLEASDLIPSQEPLLDGIGDKLASLQGAGIASLVDLRAALKSQKSLTFLSKESGVDPSYLQLLRRTVNGFFPKPRALKEFDWLDKGLVTSLQGAGIANTRQVFEATCSGADALANEIDADVKTLNELAALSGLCRIQWVSPTYARALAAAGAPSAAAVAEADPERLCQALAKANQDAKFYKGKVGLRDVRRLVHAATYVP